MLEVVVPVMAVVEVLVRRRRIRHHHYRYRYRYRYDDRPLLLRPRPARVGAPAEYQELRELGDGGASPLLGTEHAPDRTANECFFDGIGGVTLH